MSDSIDAPTLGDRAKSYAPVIIYLIIAVATTVGYIILVHKQTGKWPTSYEIAMQIVCTIVFMGILICIIGYNSLSAWCLVFLTAICSAILFVFAANNRSAIVAEVEQKQSMS